MSLAAHAATGGASSTAATSHRSSPRCGCTVMTGTDGIQAPSSSTAASITRVWVATRIFGRSWPPAHSARAGSAAASASRSTRGPAKRRGEAGRPFSPRAAPQVDEAGGDERRPDRIIADEGHETVELLAEAGRRRGQVGQPAVSASDAGRGTPAASATSGAQVGPSTAAAGASSRGAISGPRQRITAPCSRPRSQHDHADVDVGVEHLRPAHQRPVTAAGRSTAARIGSASRVTRTDCGRTRATRPPSGRASVHGPQEELGRDVRVGPAAQARASAPARGAGQLAEVRRVADHDVEGPSGLGDAAVARPRSAPPARPAGPARRCGVDLDADQLQSDRRRTAPAAAWLAAARRRPSPQAGSSTRTGAGHPRRAASSRAGATPARPAARRARAACTRPRDACARRGPWAPRPVRRPLALPASTLAP